MMVSVKLSDKASGCNGTLTQPMENMVQLTASVPPEYNKMRLDRVLAQLFPEHSRERLKYWVIHQCVQVNERIITQPSATIQGGEQIIISAPTPPQPNWQGQPIAFEVIAEDPEFIIVNKPVGLVVHPAAGHFEYTLVNGLIHRFPELAGLPRAGIIHRLDKDTTGLLLVARTLSAHTHFVKEMAQRLIQREYIALVHGQLISGGTVQAPIGRHSRQRQKMAVVTMGKPAITHYRVNKRFSHFTLLHVQLETGRTHQIRVHMTHIHHPIVGDQLYITQIPKSKGISPNVQTAIKMFHRQALHAYQLGFVHPKTGQTLQFNAPVPADFALLLEKIREED